MTASTYREEMCRELRSILRYWMLYSPDERQGGFAGRIDPEDRPDYDASKGLVLNARILWAFSAAWRDTGQWIYRPVATRAYEYLVTHFRDAVSGGFFWSLTAQGQPVETRKQIYGQAFVLYGLSEYYRAVGDQSVLDQAIGLYRLIEKHGYDPEHGGYFEAFDREWSALEDLRLSAKDANEKKTTNTNLHVLEAYTNLYHVWPDATLRECIQRLLNIFMTRIIDENKGHLRLFFSEDWTPRSKLRSYGHDIEAAWLLYAAASAIEDREKEKRLATLALRIATATQDGLDADGGLWYERENERLIPEKHWWPQAEAMVGFLYVWSISGDDQWWDLSVKVWDFVKRYIRVPGGKEWYWGVDVNHEPMSGQDKAGFWKCPYHNSRACLEIMRILGGIR